MLEWNLGCLCANLLLKAGGSGQIALGSDQIAEGFEQAPLGLTPPPAGWSHTASGSSAPVPDCPQGENSRSLNLSSFSLCPESLINPPGTAVESLAPYVLDSLLTGTGGGCRYLPSTPSLLQTEPAQLLQPLCKDMLLHLPSQCLSTALTPVCQFLVLGVPKYTIHLKLIKLFLSPSSPLWKSSS